MEMDGIRWLTDTGRETRIARLLDGRRQVPLLGQTSIRTSLATTGKAAEENRGMTGAVGTIGTRDISTGIGGELTTMIEVGLVGREVGVALPSGIEILSGTGSEIVTPTAGEVRRFYE